MKTPRHQIAKAIADRTLKPDVSIHHLSREVAAYLLETNRVGELESLLRDIMEAWAEHGIVEVIAVSAHRLDEKALADVKHEVRKKYPHAKHIMVTEKIDPNAVAGVRLNFPNEQLDLTVRNQLNRFKQLTTAGDL